MRRRMSIVNRKTILSYYTQEESQEIVKAATNIIIRFLFARCQAPSLSGRITLADDLLFRCLAHRARTALRPSSLLCSGVSLENRTFPPLRPPSLPSATACGFFAFFFAIRYSLSQIARKKNLSCLYLTAMVYS